MILITCPLIDDVKSELTLVSQRTNYIIVHFEMRVTTSTTTACAPIIIGAIAVAQPQRTQRVLVFHIVIVVHPLCSL